MYIYMDNFKKLTEFKTDFVEHTHNISNDGLFDFKRIHLILDVANCSSISDDKKKITWNLSKVFSENSIHHTFLDDNQRVYGMIMSDFFTGFYWMNELDFQTICVEEFAHDSYKHVERNFHFIGKTKYFVHTDFGNIVVNQRIVSFRTGAYLSPLYEIQTDTVDGNQGIFMFQNPNIIPTTITLNIGNPTSMMPFLDAKINIKNYIYSEWDEVYYEYYTYITLEKPIQLFNYAQTWIRIYINNIKTTQDEKNKQLIAELTRPEGWIVYVDAYDLSYIFFTNDYDDSAQPTIVFYPLIGEILGGEIIVENNNIVFGLDLLVK